jgi:hypothetical protein
MPDLLRYAGQAVVYALFAGFIGYFGSHPVIRQIPEDHAQIKLSFTHGAARKVACRRLSSEEIAKLPPKERRPNTCARERADIRVQLMIDGEIVYDAVLEPIGLSGDGPAHAYRKFPVPAGEHTIEARLRDSPRIEGFDYETKMTVDLVPLQNLAIDFKADGGGFTFR